MFVKKCTVGRDAEVRFTTKGDAVASVSLAYNYGRKGQDGKTSTQWIEASLWGKRAESSAPYLVKATQIVAVIKDLHIETYQKKDGGEGTKLVGTLDDFEFCGGKQSEHTEPARQDKPAQSQSGGSIMDMDSDLPFAPHGKNGADVSWRNL
jgi:single-strand DNA-binding protein